MVRLFQCAPLASPGFTGIPTTVTAQVGTNTAQIASCAFVLNQGATSAPLANGTAAAGVSTMFARADHVHPAPTGLAPTANPTLTGTITVSGVLIVNSTQIDKAYSLANPTSGGTVVIASTTHVEIITPPAAVLGVVAITIQFPTAQDGLRFEVAATGAFTKITCTGTGTIQNAPTSISAGGGFGYLFVGSSSTWVRLR